MGLKARAWLKIEYGVIVRVDIEGAVKELEYMGSGVI